MGRTSQDTKVLINRFAFKKSLPSHEAFGKLVELILPKEASDLEKIGAIQELFQRYNQHAPKRRRIVLLYHFTDAKGAQGIVKSGKLGREEDRRIYFTSIAPEAARPLLSARDAEAFSDYFIKHKIPSSLKEKISKFILAKKFQWAHDVQKGLLGKPIVPIGAHKLENIVIVVAGVDNPALKKDRHGELYIERPIKKQRDPSFFVFGPFVVEKKG